MEAYPFMFAKNDKGAGWSMVAAPSFAHADKEARQLLLVAQRGFVMSPSEAMIVPGEHSKLGTFDVVWRRLPSGLTDEAGRDFDFCEGMVLRSRNPSFTPLQEHLQHAHDAVMPKFKEFWNASKWSGDLASLDTAIDLEKIEASTPFTRLHQPHSIAPLAATKPLAASAHPPRTWEQRIKGAWSNRAVRGTVTGGCVVAAVAVGAFLIVSHQRRVPREENSPATQSR